MIPFLSIIFWWKFIPARSWYIWYRKRYSKSPNKGEIWNGRQDKKMTVEEAGRKGGEATADSHDKEFYQEIGKKGGVKQQ